MINYNTHEPNKDLFVADLKTISLEKLVRNKLEVFFDQVYKTDTPDNDMEGLHKMLIEPVEKALIEVALKQHRGNQAKTARMLGINRNTLKKKIDAYKIEPKKRYQSIKL